MMLRGRFRDWNNTNIAALRRVPNHLMLPKNREVLKLFEKARFGSFPNRLAYLKRSGVHRQTLLGNLGLIAAVILKKI
jgi:hypothetical protein